MSEVGHQDYQGAKLGMWLFLFSELVLFGGIFLLYAVYLHRFPEDFIQAAKQLDFTFGTINTMVLITSSLTVALAFSSLQQARRRLCLTLLVSTVFGAIVFLVIKGIEWREKFIHGLFPGSTHYQELPPGQSIFYGLYYLTTGLHGIHVLIGIALLLWTTGLLYKSRQSEENHLFLENCALYWHLVDLIWIFIFPLYYLLL
jgi:cytochrome c oxidase subunit III